MSCGRFFPAVWQEQPGQCESQSQLCSVNSSVPVGFYGVGGRGSL